MCYMRLVYSPMILNGEPVLLRERTDGAGAIYGFKKVVIDGRPIHGLNSSELA